MTTKRNIVKIEDKKTIKELDSLCNSYLQLKQNIELLTNQLDTIKDDIKNRLPESVNYYTAKHKIVISITEDKTIFEYDIDAILKIHPELKENIAFGSFRIKKGSKSLRNVERLKKQI